MKKLTEFIMTFAIGMMALGPVAQALEPFANAPKEIGSGQFVEMFYPQDVTLGDNGPTILEVRTGRGNFDYAYENILHVVGTLCRPGTIVPVHSGYSEFYYCMTR